MQANITKSKTDLDVIYNYLLTLYYLNRKQKSNRNYFIIAKKKEKEEVNADTHRKANYSKIFNETGLLPQHVTYQCRKKKR